MGEPDLNRCLYWHVLVQVLNTMMCVLVCHCIGACIGLSKCLYWFVLDCIGIVLVNVLALVLAHIKIKFLVFQVPSPACTQCIVQNHQSSDYSVL